MNKILAALVLACLAFVVQPAHTAEHAQVEQIMSKDLSDFPGKEGVLLMVTYPPGGTDVVHRHNAHGFIYVLEGSIVMQVKGGENVTLRSGQTYYGHH